MNFRFEDVIRESIVPFAFATSVYPLILSLEVRCDDQHQRTVAKILLQYLGKMLHRGPVSETDTALPSPQELQGKILIKVVLYRM